LWKKIEFTVREGKGKDRGSSGKKTLKPLRRKWGKKLRITFSPRCGNGLRLCKGREKKQIKEKKKSNAEESCGRGYVSLGGRLVLHTKVCFVKGGSLMTCQVTLKITETGRQKAQSPGEKRGERSTLLEGGKNSVRGHC